MLALRLPPEIEKRLDELARKTGRTKSFYAREAILEHLDDLEDLYLAEQRMRNDPQFVPLAEAIQEAGLTRADVDAASDH
jgi:RHH-type transcriptional regulator, rel operon repressor / antitoxin RelB